MGYDNDRRRPRYYMKFPYRVAPSRIQNEIRPERQLARRPISGQPRLAFREQLEVYSVRVRIKS